MRTLNAHKKLDAMQATADAISVDPRRVDLDLLAAELRRRLFEENMTQKELARELDVSQPTVSGWANGNKKPSSRNLSAIVDLLDLSFTAIATDPAPGFENLEDRRSIYMVPRLAPDRAGEAPDDLRGYEQFPDDPINARVSEIDNLHIREVVTITRTMLQSDNIDRESRLFIADVSDDAMAPQIPDRARIIVSLQNAFASGVFAFFDGTSIRVRKAWTGVDGGIRLRPSNSEYGIETVYPTTRDDWYLAKGSRKPVYLACLGRVELYVSTP